MFWATLQQQVNQMSLFWISGQMCVGNFIYVAQRKMPKDASTSKDLTAQGLAAWPPFFLAKSFRVNVDVLTQAKGALESLTAIYKASG